ncbi:MAG TPA: 3-deoxy-D-manno-octulosonic acid transferase [Acidisarcina sp.]
MIFSVVLFLYSVALVIALVVGLPYWLVRMATAAKYREGLAGRLGKVPPHLLKKPALPPGRRFAGRGNGSGGAILLGTKHEFETIWVHAVSVGEVAAVTELVMQLAMRRYRVVVSTTTRTGQRLARERFGEKSVFYFPLDLRRIVRRYLKVLQPCLLVLVETEFWPNVLVECERAGVQVAVVNARISDRSFPRYKRLRRLWRPILRRLSLVLAQSELDAERLRTIGVPAERVRLGGNMKFDLRPGAEADVTTALREHLGATAQNSYAEPGTQTRLLVCGSTVAGEEEMLLKAWGVLVRGGSIKTGAGMCMVLAPRHPERFPAVARLLQESGLDWVRRTEWMRAPEKLRPGTVFLLNSIGELASVYSLASVAFVGGSLVSAGGHNPLEPARFGVPVVMGPHFHNFRTIVRRMIEKDAIRIVGAEGEAAELAGTGAASRSPLVTTLSALIGDPAEARSLGARGLGVFQNESGATALAVEALLGLLVKERPGLERVERSGVVV